MTNRREFLVAAGLAAVPVSLRAGSPPPALGLAIVDERRAESRRVGQLLQSRGVPVTALSTDDITSVWLDVVGPAWRRAPTAVGGLTTRAALFCLEQLAWAQGLRVVYHSEHVLGTDGAATHRVQIGEAVFPRGIAWTAGVADRLLTHDATRCLRTGPSCVALEPELSADERLMHSWIIAAA